MGTFNINETLAPARRLQPKLFKGLFTRVLAALRAA